MTSATVCKPNISGAGRRRRRIAGYISAAVTMALFAGLALSHAAWGWRMLVFLPAATAATCVLQARRGTCLAHAAKGTFEHEDFSATKAPEDEVSASRRVAAGIRRDAALVGLACAVVAALSALVA